jgi:hypothetical protein
MGWHANRGVAFEIDAARRDRPQHGNAVLDTGGNPYALMWRHHPRAFVGSDQHRASFGEQELRPKMSMGGVHMAGRVVVANGYDRPRHRLDRFRTNVSGHGPILGNFGILLKAGRSAFS